MTIALGLTCDRRWTADTDQLASTARAAGFQSLGLGAEHIDKESAAQLRANKLLCHEVMALVVSNNQPATTRSAEQLGAKAAAIGAPWVLTVFAATMNQEGMALTKRCASILREAGCRMAVEFSPLGSVTSIAEGLEVVAAAGTERAGLLIDTWHFFSGNSSWDDLARVPLDLVAYIQFDDALSPVSDDAMDETMNRRTMPGDGVFDLGRFAGVLLERGWEGTVSVEVLSKELSSLAVDDFARRAYRSTAGYWL